jgi:hypothetical protein
VPTDEVTAWLARYRPRKVDASTWADVRDFVCDTAAMAKPANIEDAARVTRVLMKLAIWCLAEGLALEREVIVDPAVVERFIALSEGKSASRAVDRWLLRKIGPMVTTSAPWEPRPAPVAHRNIAPPYTASEMRQLRADAQRQPGELSRQASWALVVLGAGVGLDGRWVARVRPADVSIENGVVLVEVGEPAARIVPVLAAFEEEVLELAATCTTGCLIGVPSQARSRVAVITSRLTVGLGHPPFSAARFRSTWLTTHLSLGTRLPELAKAAGLRSTAHLADLVPYIEALADCEARQLLRGPS